ncbi:hypothetical protein H072_2015 [Dactylellina haptotyla CBS 200.50]|uniref:Chromo domain-containing protein n=1 Tax=Dactylellina haptotyla (strain CBS 200.50) TaxID=1284197 RepID=S8AM24_DACHA|nr:hypothetical protein H072_2015 [Dactylellina haptotyla CBS 200.50]
MKTVLTPDGRPASLPRGWHRWFLALFFGEAKGVYTNWPGPVPGASSCLSFLGLTFTRARAQDDDPSWTENLRVPGEDRSWSGSTLDPVTDDEESDPKLAVIRTPEEKPTLITPERVPRGKYTHRRHRSEGIQPDEVIEPADNLASSEQLRRKSEQLPDSRDGASDHHDEKPKRKSRHSASSSTTGRNQRQYFMETTTTDEPPDSSVFDETTSEFIPSHTERARYKTRKSRRRSSLNSSVSNQSGISHTDSLPRAPSPPLEEIPPIQMTPSPRKGRRRASGPASPSSSARFRNLSPIADYQMRAESSSDSYIPTPDSSSQTSWSGYASPPLPPMPTSPSSTLSYSSRQSFLSNPTSAGDEIFENINGEFTVRMIRSVSETEEGRYYKVRWASTWESKSSMRAATESGKYTVKEILESRYVNGKGLYRVRWKDTWESEQELGDIEPVRDFWTESGPRRRESSNVKSFA